MAVRRRNSWQDNPEYWARRKAATAQRDRERAQARSSLVDYVHVEVSKGVSDAVIAAMTQGVNSILKGELESIARRFRNTKEIQEIHRDVGHAALRSIRASIGQNITARRGPASSSDQSYRGRKSRLSGHLQTAFSTKNDATHVQTEGTVLRFLDINTLDQEAAHWYRLNFGVGARGSRGRSGLYELKIGGQSAGEFGLNTGPSKHPLIIPPGFFLNAEGKRVPANMSRRGMEGFFLPGEVHGVQGRPMRARLSKGIEGRNYLDAGVRRIARELPNRYEEFFREAVASKIGAPLTVINVHVPTSRRRLTTLRGSTRPRRLY